MERRQFLSIPLAALATAAVPGMIAGQNPASASTGLVLPTVAAPVKALKGFGHSGQDAMALQQIKSLKLSWYYTWGSRYYVTTSPAFVPMVKSAKTLLEQDALGHVSRQLAETKSKHLLGFNEPDVKLQANMTVEEAIRLWPKLEQTGLRLGSPATAKPSSLWLQSFMDLAKKNGLRVDFMTMHCYGWPNATDFLNKVRMLHEKYGKPVWVTEYAVADWSATTASANRYTRKQTEDFMRETVAGMRAMPYVERFAWKTRPSGDPVMWPSALFYANGDLSSTGRLYASL